MVNAAKRMRALTEKVYRARNGAGSIVLPSSSGEKCKISSIYMRLPTGQYPNREYFAGARDFWHRECRRLKYWNPAMSTKVDTVRNGENEPMYLTVEYESTNREDLSQLQSQPLPKPQLKIRPMANTREEAQQQMREMRQGVKETEPDARKEPSMDSRSIAEQLGLPPQFAYPRKLTQSPKELKPIKMTPGILSHAPSDDITVKSQPASNPSTPQSTSPPEVIYSRKLTLPLAGLRHHEIWNWIRQHTGLRDHRIVPSAEQRDWTRLASFKKEAQKDKILVRAGVGAMKREAAELKKAREMADRMAADNA